MSTETTPDVRPGAARNQAVTGEPCMPHVWGAKRCACHDEPTCTGCGMCKVSAPPVSEHAAIVAAVPRAAKVQPAEPRVTPLGSVMHPAQASALRHALNKLDHACSTLGDCTLTYEESMLVFNFAIRSAVLASEGYEVSTGDGEGPRRQ